MNEQQRGYLSTINASGEALLTIINDILDFSKIESGKLALEPMDFDLKTMLSDTLNLMRSRADEKDIDIRFNYPDEAPTHFNGDPDLTTNCAELAW